MLSTYKEPVPGWTDNLYGPTGLCAAAARGLVHVIYGSACKKANLVPADYCVNAIISAAWDVNQRSAASAEMDSLGWTNRLSLIFRYPKRMQSQSPLPVYNYIYSTNNLTWGKYMKLAQNGMHQPLDKALW